MTTAITRQEIRRELYNQVPGLGFYGTADSVAAGSITDTFALRDSLLGQNHYRGMYIYRPDRSTDDRVKKAHTLTNTTGVLTHSGSSYADTADLNYEIVGLLHPDELNACIQRAQTRIYREELVVLTLITDGDMRTTGVGSWSDVGTPATKEKVTTASRLLSGTQALHVLNDATDEGVQSATIRGFGTNGGENVYVSAVVHADVGTATLVLWDVTNSAVISSVSSTEEGFAHLWLQESLPTTCEEIAVRLLGEENNADLYWNHAVLYRRDMRMLPAPSWLDDAFKFLKLREARYTKNISTQADGGYDDAQSRTFSDWLQPSMFDLLPLHTDANPYQIELLKRIPREELWIHAKRPYSDTEALSTESSTTRAPARLVYAYSKEELAKVLTKRYPTDARWKLLLDEATAEMEAEVKARPEAPLQPIMRTHLGRI